MPATAAPIGVVGVDLPDDHECDDRGRDDLEGAATGWVERRFPAMGSTAHVVVLGGTAADLDWVERETERLEALWSRFRPDSDVARCTGAAGAGPTVVAPETLALVERALHAWRATDGHFDPTVLRALEAAGYGDSFERVRARPQARTVVSSAPPGRPAIDVLVDDLLRDPSVPAPGCEGVTVDREHGTVTLPAGTGLDLGGIGKGAAADHLARGLVARGVPGACVALGGDVRAVGAIPGGAPWPIPVEDPFDVNRTLLVVPLRDAAVVTSTRLIHRWVHRGTAQHHIIDPVTGRPADRGVAAVVVTADEAWWAESLAKAALVAGPRGGVALLEHHGVAGWVIDDDRRVWPTAATRRMTATRRTTATRGMNAGLGAPQGSSRSSWRR
jgi:thiamine biosynthesis lipoprotein